MSEERITGAAIRLARGTIYSGPFGGLRHGHLMHEMYNAGESVGDIAHAQQGFVTSERMFVDRAEGMKVAKAARQIRTTRVVDGIERTHEPTGAELYTEDLW